MPSNPLNIKGPNTINFFLKFWGTFPCGSIPLDRISRTGNVRLKALNVDALGTLIPRRLALLFSTFLFGLTLTALPASAGVAEGKALCDANCARCHQPHRRGTGPALFGAVERWADTANLYSWIKNSTAYLKTQDPYAVALWEEYQKSVMPAFPQFEDKDIADILAYMSSWPPPDSGPSVAGGGGVAGNGKPVIDPTVLIIIVVVLAFLAYLLGRVSEFLRQRVAEKYDEEIPEPVPFLNRPGIKPLFGMGMFILVCFLGYSTYDGATALGRQENYMPDQPIKFSHALHAGTNKIDCRYCHVGAEKGKSAVIPSMNVCMNCHYDVQEGTQYGTTEIAKIYKSVGFNPENLQYEGEQEPVEWVRVHNLPDHVYFNHAQHANVGEIECQTCHGPVEEMEVLYQYESLSMGWCVNCHRETEVQFATNSFYGDYDELHKDLASGKLDAVHVVDIGGTECQKCHY